MNYEELKNETILLSPLNWGYGHVSRSIGLVFKLIQNNKIIIACDSEQQEIFSFYFKNKVEFIKHEGYPFQFGGKGNFSMDLLKNFKKLKNRLKLERKEVELYVKNHNISLVISDHRYGFLSKNVRSIFLTHQLNLPIKWHQFIVQKWHRNLINSFNDIWVPDYNDQRLSGELSSPKAFKNVHFIGPLSRFMMYGESKNMNEDILLASGPFIYAQQLIDMFPDFRGVIIGSEKLNYPQDSNLIKGNWLEQDESLRNASKIISRSGYSTIMDNEFLKKELQLMPTQGQLEQEYLYNLHSN